MEHLRWILIVAGVLILIGIILFANPNRRAKPARSRKSGRRNTAVRRVEPTLDSPDTATDNLDGGEQQSIAGLDISAAQQSPDTEIPLTGNDTVSSQPEITSPEFSDAASSESQPSMESAGEIEQSGAAPGDDQIVSLYVVGLQRHPISGVELLDAALKAGLSFGAQDIFHRLPEGSDKPLFSMANLTAPGHFDRTAWNLFETQGVTLFMTLPGPTSALVAWDSMLATAERLAELLKAEVQDKQRQVLTRQTIAHQREAMRAYDRQKQ